MRQLRLLPIVCALFTACDPMVTPPQADVAEVQPRVRPIGSRFGNWTVEIELRNGRSGDLRLETRRPAKAPRGSARPWIRHELVFHNTGDHRLRFDDTRDSGFVRKRRRPVLLVADEGCGYGLPEPHGRIEPGACASYLDEFLVPAGGSVSREVTLFKGLRGFRPLDEGVYRYRKRIRFGVAGTGTVEEHTVALIYKIGRDE